MTTIPAESVLKSMSYLSEHKQTTVDFIIEESLQLTDATIAAYIPPTTCEVISHYIPPTTFVVISHYIPPTTCVVSSHYIPSTMCEVTSYYIPPTTRYSHYNFIIYRLLHVR